MGQKISRLKWLGLAIALCTLIIACQPTTPVATDAAAPGNPEPASAPLVLNGTGASFPLFIYERIFSEYRDTFMAVVSGGQSGALPI